MFKAASTQRARTGTGAADDDLRAWRTHVLTRVSRVIALVQLPALSFAAYDVWKSGRPDVAIFIMITQSIVASAALPLPSYRLRVRLLLYPYVLGLPVAASVLGLTSGVGALDVFLHVLAVLLLELPEAVAVGVCLNLGLIAWRLLVGWGVIARPQLPLSDVGDARVTIRLLVNLCFFAPAPFWATAYLLRRLSESLRESKRLVEELRGRMVLQEEETTRRHHTEQKLWAAQKLEALGQLAGGVAHDVNNNLTIALANAELIESDEGASSLHREMAREIREASQNAASLTRHLLTLGRREVMRPEVISIRTVVARAARLILPSLSKTQTLRVDVSEDLPKVCVDPGQMVQVLLNLALNARDAMVKGGELSIVAQGDASPMAYQATSSPNEPADVVRIHVRDEGVGIAPTTLERIFEPFFTTKGEGKGTGLGLSMAASFAEATGGRIGVRSQEGAGTTFTLELPPLDSLATAALPGEPGVPLPEGGTVLVAEDDERIRGIMSAVLREARFRVLEAGNGAEAIAVAAREPVDLLCTDVIMPIVNGDGLIRHFREHHVDTRILVCSAFVESTALRALLQARAFPVLPKPFTPSQLLAAVRDSFRSSS